jgi:glyoxylase-like metal-dependent hydrolase (beta-lactamase superfamily II)
MPGHSPGHLAFAWPERSLLIAGDAVATWPSLCAGWTAFTLDRAQHAVSLRRMAARRSGGSSLHLVRLD